MAEREELTKTFAVRDVAPTTVVLGNIGLVQAVRLGVDGVRRLMEAIEADAIAIHLNPGQELTQPEGDRDFRGGYDIISKLVKALGSEHLLVKETGCGISGVVARKLVDCGVRTIDVSGLGGTSWVRVEQLRANGIAHEIGAQFSGWGIPTAAAVSAARKAVGPGVTLIAAGGLRTGLDVAKALALGANVGGMALPLFRAHQEGGVARVEDAMRTILASLTQALVLTGCAQPEALSSAPKVVVGELKDWLAASL
jgi:isopentenyl-diphosphate delta-isomerase